jgi:hypothetical protein
MRIYLHHARSIPVSGRRPGYCVSGCRAFAERHNLDMMTFARDGIDESVLLATGDAMAQKIVDYAHSLEALNE